MRRVSVSRKIFQASTTHPSNPGHKPGQWIQQDYLAVFHDFGLDTDTSQGQYSIYPVALLELADGSIQIVHAEHIRFISPTPYETCENDHSI